MNTSNITLNASASMEQAHQSHTGNFSLDHNDVVDNHTETTAPARPLSFLDLPTELRVMVYERIEVERHYEHATIRPRYHGRPEKISRSQLTYPTSILATCHQIRAEAQPVLDKKIELLKNQPVRLHASMRATGLFTRVGAFDPLFGISEFDVEAVATMLDKRRALYGSLRIQEFEIDMRHYGLWLHAQKAERQSDDPEDDLVRIPAEMRTLQGVMARTARAIRARRKLPLTDSSPCDLEFVWNEHICDICPIEINPRDIISLLEERTREGNISIAVKVLHVDRYRHNFWEGYFGKAGDCQARHMTDVDDAEPAIGDVHLADTCVGRILKRATCFLVATDPPNQLQPLRNVSDCFHCCATSSCIF